MLSSRYRRHRGPEEDGLGILREAKPRRVRVHLGLVWLEEESSGAKLGRSYCRKSLIDKMELGVLSCFCLVLR